MTVLLRRRTLLGLALTAGAACSGIAVTAAPTAAGVPSGWRRWQFDALVGQHLTVTGGGRLRLLRALPGPDGDDAAFSLLFAPAGIPATDALLELHHAALGRFLLGLTAVGARGRLQAVIDHRPPPPTRKGT